LIQKISFIHFSILYACLSLNVVLFPFHRWSFVMEIEIDEILYNCSLLPFRCMHIRRWDCQPM
jgi:hypothetical protein